MHPQDPTVLKRFASDERGNIAVVFALALLPLVESAEAAIDDSKSSADQARMQAALDGAVLAGAKDGTDGWIATDSPTPT
jgi:Flp pilus assembly protein TadG